MKKLFTGALLVGLLTGCATSYRGGTSDYGLEPERRNPGTGWGWGGASAVETPLVRPGGADSPSGDFSTGPDSTGVHRGP